MASRRMWKSDRASSRICRRCLLCLAFIFFVVHSAIWYSAPYGWPSNRHPSSSNKLAFLEHWYLDIKVIDQVYYDYWILIHHQQHITMSPFTDRGAEAGQHIRDVWRDHDAGNQKTQSKDLFESLLTRRLNNLSTSCLHCSCNCWLDIAQTIPLEPQHVGYFIQSQKQLSSILGCGE